MDTVQFRRGIALFDSEQYFQAHEVLEDVWRAAPAEEKLFLQGLIQIAVALHHHSRGNLEGARSLLARAHRNLMNYPESYAGVNLVGVRTAIADCQHALDTGGPLTPFRISAA